MTNNNHPPEQDQPDAAQAKFNQAGVGTPIVIYEVPARSGRGFGPITAFAIAITTAVLAIWITQSVSADEATRAANRIWACAFPAQPDQDGMQEADSLTAGTVESSEE